jgi:hypothetical protein
MNDGRVLDRHAEHRHGFDQEQKHDHVDVWD